MTLHSTCRETSCYTLATPYFAQAYKLHSLIFHHVYPFPMKIHIKHDKISIQVDNFLQIKYIPFVFAVMVVTGVIGFGSCVILPVIALFRPLPNFEAVAEISCVLGASCSLLEIGTYFTYCNAKELEYLFNQLMKMERSRKFAVQI